MIVGALGEIVFEVTPETVRTLDKLAWSGSARWATHERHLTNALTEFTGIDPDKISFSVYLNAFLGASVQTEIAQIFKYERAGTPLQLVIGEKAYGKYRWVITDHETAADAYDGRGNITSCSVKINLLEYLKE